MWPSEFFSKLFFLILRRFSYRLSELHNRFEGKIDLLMSTESLYMYEFVTVNLKIHHSFFLSLFSRHILRMLTKKYMVSERVLGVHQNKFQTPKGCRMSFCYDKKCIIPSPCLFWLNNSTVQKREKERKMYNYLT